MKDLKYAADVVLLAPAYEMYIQHLLKLLDEERKESRDSDDRWFFREQAKQEVIFGFIKRTCGREVLLALGQALDESEEARTGKNPGFVEMLDAEY